MKSATLYKILLCFLLVHFIGLLRAQQPNILRGLGNRGSQSTGTKDSFQRRDKFEDSLTISYGFIDSTRSRLLDSSVADYTIRFPVPPTEIYLGNVGTAARSIVFNPHTKAGWDAGFHAFDIYKLQLHKARFFTATRPYTELGYMLGSQAQQIIEVLHTQNFKPHWNMAFRYRLINAPGFFKNQGTNHNTYLISSWYQSPNRRYNNYGIVVRNKLQSAENGGIRNDTNYLDNPIYDDRFSVPTKLGGNRAFSRDFFNAELTTGNRYKEVNLLMRQQYDLGKKDSIVTDSTVVPLFYPRLRFEHTFTYGKYSYQFRDYAPDSVFYADRYDLNIVNADSTRMDMWREFKNDFSIYQFPDAKNLSQFIKAGIEYQLLKGSFNKDEASLYNFMAHGEYRNRTRNQKWDAVASGRLWLNGYNAGDYHAYIS
ncbi:MAG: putative porin, partial [Chitinophagaceae bacterium]